MTTASAVVIGRGIVGTSIAHYLAAKGLGGVVLLERDSIAEHATGKTGGLIRTHYANPHDPGSAELGAKIERLMPASMKLLGDWNWYLPRWLEWLPKIEMAE